MAKKSVYIRATTLDYLPRASTKRVFDKIALKDPGLIALRVKAKTDGFNPISGKESNWGLQSSWSSSDGKQFTYDFHIETYKKGKDQACILTETLRLTGKQSITYKCFLTAPQGNYNKISEFYTTPSNKVRRANSRWTRFTKCAKSSCGSTCAGALVTCSGSFWAYVGCVAAICGGCMVKCGACALCNCCGSWKCGWCKYYLGCCKD